MRRNSKTVSKFHRLRLTDDIRKLIRDLPLHGLEETQVGDHVYMANGEIRLGIVKRTVRIRISHKDGLFMLSVKSAHGLEVELPFDTPEERTVAPAEVRKRIRSLLD